MLSVWYAHGAGATKRSFAWLSKQLPSHNASFFEYELEDSLAACIVSLSTDIAENGPGIVIGHSLGGLIAAGVITHPKVLGVVTMCAPFGGLPVASFMSMVRHDQLFRDLTPHTQILRSICQDVEKSKKPHLAIVASHGLPYTSQPNDGVVTLSSATAIRNTEFQTLPVNHFEVLLDYDTARLISKFMTQFPQTELV